MMNEQKAFRLKVDGVDEDGVFEGYASTFGNVDLDGEVVERGAFAKTIEESAGVVPILWQHDPHDPIGYSQSLKEDRRGLRVVGELNLDVDNGRAAHSLMRQADRLGAKFGLSIGYRVVQDGIERGRRHLKELALREFSPVTFPANPKATVTTIKSADDLASLVLWAKDAATEGRVFSDAQLDQIDAAHKALEALLTGAADSDDEPGKSTLVDFWNTLDQEVARV